MAPLTKCPKCSYPLRYAPEQIGLDSNNIPIYNRFGYCDNCKSKYNVDATNPVLPSSTKKEESALGIFGFVLGLLMCFPIFPLIGLILCVIAIMQNNKKTTFAKIGIIVSLFGLIIGINVMNFFSEVGSSNASNTASTETISTETTTDSYDAPLPSTEPLDIAPSTINCAINNCNIKYIDYDIITNPSDEECIVIYYEFTNNSTSNKQFYTVADAKAFQNGIELETSIWKVDGYGDNAYLEIKTDATLTVACSYVLRDKSNVELEVYEWIDFTGKPVASMIIEIE